MSSADYRIAAIAELESFEKSSSNEVTRGILREAIAKLRSAAEEASTKSAQSPHRTHDASGSSNNTKENMEMIDPKGHHIDGPVKMEVSTSPHASSSSISAREGRKYEEIAQFGWDQDPAYGSGSKKNVYVYVTLPGVGKLPPGSIDVRFEPRGFDLVIHDYQGKNLRLARNNLEKEIDVSKSRYRVSSSGGDRITITMKKKEGDEHWIHLTSKKLALGADSSSSPRAGADDPAASLMDMMKQMYDEGDDTMKKTIGEAMMKSRSGAAVGGGVM